MLTSVPAYRANISVVLVFYADIPLQSAEYAGFVFTAFTMFHFLSTRSITFSSHSPSVSALSYVSYNA